MEVTEVIFDSKYSTTRKLMKSDIPTMIDAVKALNKPEDKFETVLFLPEGENRQGEGGLRTQGYFKRSYDYKPLITVVTVVYIGEEFLEETILSVINQSYDNVECIIVDGGSTDSTLDIIKKYEHAIDYWVSEKDAGIYDAMNKGIDLATGDWINFMNGGDSFYSIESLNSIFKDQNFNKVDIVYGNHQVIYPAGQKRFAKAGLLKDFWKGSRFCHQASLVRISYHKRNKFNLCTKIVADFEFFYNSWKAGVKFQFVDIYIAKFQSGGVSDSRRIESILRWWIIVDNSLRINVFYCLVIIKESLKLKVKYFV
jgi:glycosyltransferase involved in cell wall biosynthesis